MKLLLVLMMFIPALITSADPQPLTIGDTAPNFTLTDIFGKTYTLSDFKGKTVVLEWMNPGCPFVVAHYKTGNMPKLQKKYTAEGVIWLTINSTRPDHPEAQTAEECKKTFAAWKSGATANLMDADRSVGRLYDAKTTPHMYIIAPDGKIAYQGAIDDDRSTNGGANAKVNFVAQALDELKAGKPVSISTTKSYGCAVKY